MARIIYLWRTLFKKSRGAIKILSMLQNTHGHAVTFGTTANLLHEERREVKYNSSRYAKIVLDPHGQFHKVWDLIILILLCYTAFVGPF